MLMLMVLLYAVSSSAVHNLASKLSPKAGYSYKVTDAAKCRVRISGNTNFTGSITVTAEK